MIRSLILPLNPTEEQTESGEEVTPQITLRRNLTQENLEACLAEGSDMWIDIVTPETDEIRWLEDWLNLSPNVVKDLLREDRRPTLMVYPGYLFLSLFQPAVPTNNGGGIVGKEIHCIIGEHYYITVRQSDARSLEEAYNRAAQNPDYWNHGVAYFLYLTAQHVVDSYYPMLDRITNQLNDLEEKLMNNEGGKQAQKSLYRIKQQLIGLRRMIAPQREVLSNLIGEQRISGNEDIRDLFRHLYERLLGIYEVIDSQRELTANVLDIIANQESRRMGEAVNRLTIFSMIFLPFTFFLGLFGLEFITPTEPLILPISGMAMMVMIIFLMVVSVLGMILYFRHRNWI